MEAGNKYHLKSGDMVKLSYKTSKGLQKVIKSDFNSIHPFLVSMVEKDSFGIIIDIDSESSPTHHKLVSFLFEGKVYLLYGNQLRNFPGKGNDCA